MSRNVVPKELFSVPVPDNTGDRLVKFIAAAPNGRSFASITALTSEHLSSTVVDIWDLYTTSSTRLERRTGTLCAKVLTFAPDAAALAVAGEDGSVRVYELPSGTLTREIPSLDAIQKQVVSLHWGNRLFLFEFSRGSESGQFWAWDVVMGEKVVMPPFGTTARIEEVSGVGVTRDSSICYVAMECHSDAFEDNRQFWPEDPSFTREYWDSELRDPHKSAESGNFAAVAAWDLACNQLTDIVADKDCWFTTLVLSEVGGYLVLSTGHRVQLCTVPALGSPIDIFLDDDDTFDAMATSPDGTLIAASTGKITFLLRPDGTLVGKIQCRVRMECHLHILVKTLAFLPDNRSLVAGDIEGEISAWQIY